MTEFGISASYWKLTRVSIDTAKKEISFSLFLYVDKENQHRELDEYCFTSFLVEDFEPQWDEYFRKDRGEKYKDIYTACYQFAKNNIEFFNDAVNDEEEQLLNN